MKLHRERFRAFMEERGLNQTSMADRLGVSRKYVNRLLANDPGADPATLLGRMKREWPEVSVDYFIREEN